MPGMSRAAKAIARASRRSPPAARRFAEVPRLCRRRAHAVEAVLSLVTRITAQSRALTVDFEAAYGDTRRQRAESVSALLRAGQSGFNLEDGLLAGQRTLVDPALHAAKIRAIRRAADDYGVRLVINARTGPIHPEVRIGPSMLEESVRRGAIYAEAGRTASSCPS